MKPIAKKTSTVSRSPAFCEEGLSIRPRRTYSIAKAWKIPTDDQSLRKAAATLQRRLLLWYHQTRRDLPWRVHWQNLGSPYHVWISEIMLQQTVIKAVIPAYERFIAQFPNLESLVAASEEQVRQASRGLGYYRRFRMMHQAAKVLLEQQAAEPGYWPRSFQDWQKLPGIGSYTAAAIASIAFDEAVPVVDGNVKRVFCRLLDIREEPDRSYLKNYFFDLGLDLISKKEPGNFNQAVMELGQTLCTKQSPSCELCPLSFCCLARERQSQAEAPKTKSRPTPTQMRGYLLIATEKGRVGLLKRPEKAKFLPGHLGFVTGFIQDNEELTWDGHEARKFPSEQKPSLGKIRHTITRYRLELDVRLFRPQNRREYTWIAEEEVEERLVANLDRKAWQLAQRTFS